MDGNLNFDDIKKSVIDDKNIELSPNHYFCYIDHTKKLCTTGFKSQNTLVDYGNNIRFDKDTIRIMRNRYITLFEGRI